ncbi:hypothetical protein [Paenarthrobacter sp. Y-19]|uniref:hypothetical protein n=1 Tax=Paenarthrobacter sp. Y-19 TaxID=3031125 RepID=UPI0023DC81CE|nr:hypothetical protein [Paenarthrobacter sp. Y-19]
MSTPHNTAYPVYEAADNCGHPAPEDDTSDEYADWENNHPEGEGLSDCLQICELSPIGVFCQECSQDNGDWIGHLTYCDACGYPFEDDGACQCELAEAQA